MKINQLSITCWVIAFVVLEALIMIYQPGQLVWRYISWAPLVISLVLIRRCMDRSARSYIYFLLRVRDSWSYLILTAFSILLLACLNLGPFFAGTIETWLWETTLGQMVYILCFFFCAYSISHVWFQYKIPAHGMVCLDGRWYYEGDILRLHPLVHHEIQYGPCFGKIEFRNMELWFHDGPHTLSIAEATLILDTTKAKERDLRRFDVTEIFSAARDLLRATLILQASNAPTFEDFLNSFHATGEFEAKGFPVRWGQTNLLPA